MKQIKANPDKSGERKYEDLFNFAPAGYFTVGENGLILEVNLTGAVFLGMERSSLIGKALSCFIAADDRHIYDMHCKQALATNTRQTCEITLMKDNGSQFHAQLESIAVQDDNSNLTQYRTVIIDITERKQTEKMLQKAHDEIERQLDEHSYKLVLKLVTANEKLKREIKERRQAEDTLRNMERKLRAFVDNMPGKVSIKDTKGRYIHGNKTFEDDLNLNKKEWVGKTNTELFPPDIAAGFNKQDKKVLASRKTLTFEGTFRQPNGELRHFRTTKFPVFSDDGQLTSIGSITIDITHQKLLEDARKRSEERYRRLFEASPVSLLEEDSSEIFNYINTLRNNGVRDFAAHFQDHPEEVWQCARMVKILDVNKATLDLYGAKSNEELFENFHLLFTEEYFPGFSNILCAIANGKKALEIECVNKKLTGEVIYLIMRWSVVPGFEATLARVLVSLTDITEKKKAQDILRKERNFITAVLDNAGALILVQDWNGRILRFNKACERLTGYTFDQMRGRFLWDTLLIREETDAMKRIFHYTHEGVFPSKFENNWVTRNGDHRLIAWSNTVMAKEKDSDNHIVSIGTDITEKRKAEEEAELRRRQLMQADKMISLGILVSGVAHEINNPNNFIMLNTPVLQEAWESIMPILEDYYKKNGDFMLADIPYSEMREHIPQLFSGISEGAERIKQIVLNLKDYAREDSSDMEQDVDINEVTKAALLLLANHISKSTKFLSVSYSGKLPPVRGNSQRIEQVIVNLIQNACQALPSQDKGIEINSFYDEKDNMVVVRIKDEGIGISGKDIDRIFDPFFTTKRDFGGTGLGLSICSGIVKEHGGKLEFTSEPGKGTTVALALPGIKYASED